MFCPARLIFGDYLFSWNWMNLGDSDGGKIRRLYVSIRFFFSNILNRE